MNAERIMWAAMSLSIPSGMRWSPSWACSTNGSSSRASSQGVAEGLSLLTLHFSSDSSFSQIEIEFCNAPCMLCGRLLDSQMRKQLSWQRERNKLNSGLQSHPTMQSRTKRASAFRAAFLELSNLLHLGCFRKLRRMPSSFAKTCVSRLQSRVSSATGKIS